MRFWLSFLCVLFCKQSHLEADYAHGVHVFSRPLPVKPVVTLLRSWKNTMPTHSFFPKITFPTRVSNSSGATVIANIFVSYRRSHSKLKQEYW